MKLKLTRMDEFPRHQTGVTFDTVNSNSPHWSDGYYYTLGDDQGRVAFFSALRLYATNDVMDAFTCVSGGGLQHNMRFSRRLRPRIDDLECGAMSVDIIEGLRRIRTRAEPNEFGISYDLLWEGFTPPYNEEYQITFTGGRLTGERSNYDQVMDVSGWLEVKGVRYEVEPEHWTGVRDHSWGIGPTGGPPSNVAAPLPRGEPFGLRQWVWFKLPDRAIFWHFHRNAAGQLTKFESVCMYPYGDAREPFVYTNIEQDLEFVPGERRLIRGTVEMTRPDGRLERFLMENITDPVYLEGGGYWQGYDDHLGRGVYRGDDHSEGETWDVSHPTLIGDPRGLAQARPDGWCENFGRFTNLDNPAEVGIGHLECVVSGSYPGFPEERK